jgi:hypothetical protein
MMPSATQTAPPPPTDFSPQASLWQQGLCAKPPARWRTCQVDAQPERCARDPRHSEPSGRRKQSHNPRELGTEVPRSITHNEPSALPFLAMAITIRNTTKVEIHATSPPHTSLTMRRPNFIPMQ